MSIDQPLFVLRETADCPHCALHEYLTEDGRCRRCHRPLGVEYLRLDLATEGNGVSALPGQIGTTIRSLRARRQISQDALARAAGIARPYLSRIENSVQCPGLSTLLRVMGSRALGLQAVIFRFEMATASSNPPTDPHR